MSLCHITPPIAGQQQPCNFCKHKTNKIQESKPGLRCHFSLESSTLYAHTISSQLKRNGISSGFAFVPLVAFNMSASKVATLGTFMIYCISGMTCT